MVHFSAKIVHMSEICTHYTIRLSFGCQILRKMVYYSKENHKEDGDMQRIKAFLQRKEVCPSARLYFIDAMGDMTLDL